MRKALNDLTGRSVHVATQGVAIVLQIRQCLASEVRHQTAHLSIEQALELSDCLERAIAEQRQATERVAA